MKGPSLLRWRSWVVGASVLTLLCGCGSLTGRSVKAPQESFGANETYSRLVDAPPARACEAGRRALLSQGYLVSNTGAELVEGVKHFQPDAESHMKMRIRVVCVPESSDAQVSLAFVTGVQESYNLKKANNSASLGLSAIGSVSIPFLSGSDSMVKVGEETIANGRFYDSFFDLLTQYLASTDPVADAGAASAAASAAGSGR